MSPPLSHQTQKMIYIFNPLEHYSAEQFSSYHLALPAWRREKALQYKKLDDRKRSVLAFVLLQRALREEYGITEVPKFVYNEFGKPSLPNLPIHFSLSHCKDAVACAVSDYNIGIDVESIVPYNPDVARRVCSKAELKKLEQSENKDVDFIKLWTMKEAISKFDGRGLTMSFNEINIGDYTILTQEASNYILSVCFGKASGQMVDFAQTEIKIINNIDV